MTIRRPDGSWIFHFVNVVDDIEMKISHVIRGEDHLSNTPKHIELYRALGATPPCFAHIPLILNKDGSKMSKRDQGASLNTYIEGGYLPEAVRNYLCLLGWSPKDNREKTRDRRSRSPLRPGENPSQERVVRSRQMHLAQWRIRARTERRAISRSCAGRLWNEPASISRNFPPDYVRAALETCKGKFRIFSELPAIAVSISRTISNTILKASRNISFPRTSRACSPFAKRLPRWKTLTRQIWRRP